MVSSNAMLSVQIHGLEYETQASVQVNNSGWIPLNSTSVQVLGLAKMFGGIGGGFSTLNMWIPLPAGTVVNGNNTVSFRFNATDGVSSGFRVLSFNFRNGDGSQLLPATTFVREDITKWTPPSTAASDIAAGKMLYQSAALTQPVPGSSAQHLNAHCGDCHTVDGRDLKYFNYSNNSIYVRAIFHGLNATQANQIVSYIRTLSAPAPGNARPWNPPYQPGPGLDSQPVTHWAGGAGLGAVLTSDAAMVPYIAPTQTLSDFNPNGNLSIRNTPIPYQLLDWDHWLPRIAPVDAYGSLFLNSSSFSDYKALSKSLVANNASVYAAQKYLLSDWSGDTTNFRASAEPAQSDSSWSNPQSAEKIYGIQQWQMVKLWELNQIFGLEGMAQTVFGSQADSRAWYTNAPFQTSPSITKIPPGSPGIHNGSVVTFNNVSFLWYYLQLVLNNSNKRQECTNPVEFGYFYGFISAQGRASGPQAALYLTVLEKALQISQNGVSPQNGCVNGWNWAANDPSQLVQAPNQNNAEDIWSGMSSSTRANLINSYLTQWLAAVQQWTPQEYYSGGFTSANETLSGSWYGGAWAGRVAWMIPHLKYDGMTQTLANEIAAWAKTIWPGYNWSTFANAACSPNSNGYIVCSSDSLL
jgi:mono/diheme cytochrome c family protein